MHKTLSNKQLHCFIRLLNEVLRYTHSPWLTLQGQRREETQQKLPVPHKNLLWKQDEDNQAVYAGGCTLFLSQFMWHSLSCQQFFCFSCLHLLLAPVWRAYRNIRVHPPASCVLKFATHCFSDILWHPDIPTDGFIVLPEGTNSERGGRFPRSPTRIPVLYTSYSNVLNWKDMEYFSGNKSITSWREEPMCR